MTDVQKNMEWLKTLTDQQVMALAAQHGVLDWSGRTIQQLRRTLSKLDAITAVCNDMRRREAASSGCCGEETGGGTSP